MNRFFDVLFSIIGIIILSPFFILIYFLGLLDTGAPIFKQKRVGRNKKPFNLLKFRSMKLSTASIATHLVDSKSVTNFGRFLRKSKLDEIPQLLNVLSGDMSIVGPRPNLFNQVDLISERDALDIYSVRPGITGLAQINKIDMSTPKLLAETDYEMIKNLNLFSYFKYIFLTMFGNGFGDRIRTKY